MPDTHVARAPVVVATLDEVRILDGATVIAAHPRSFDKDDCVEISGHIADLARHKRHARRLRGQDRLFLAAPASERLLADSAPTASASRPGSQPTDRAKPRMMINYARFQVIANRSTAAVIMPLINFDDVRGDSRQCAAACRPGSGQSVRFLLAGAMMMAHIGQPKVAEKVHNAWLKTIEDGIHTYDIYEEGVSKQKVGTAAFAEAIIARLGQKPMSSALA